MFSKAKAKLGDASDKAKAKMDSTKAKADEVASKELDDFLQQMSLLGPVMKDSGFQLVDVSLILQIIPAISCTIENLDQTDELEWNETRLDESKLNKTGKSIVWAMKKAAQAREQFKGKVMRFSSFEFEATLAPVLTLSFEPRSKDDAEDSKEQESEELAGSLPQFLGFYDLLEYESKLAQAGVKLLADLKKMDDNAINALCDKIGLKSLQKSSFIRACGELKNGSYKTV